MTASARDAVDNRVLDEASARGESYDIAWTVAAPGAGFTSPDLAGGRLERRMPYRLTVGGTRIKVLLAGPCGRSMTRLARDGSRRDRSRVP